MTTLVLKSNTEPNTRRDGVTFNIVEVLPLEIVEKIFSYLPSDDLLSAGSCCLAWEAALNNEFMWKSRCQSAGYLELKESKRSKFYNGFLKRYNYWQGVYRYHHALQQNWENNNYKEVIHEIKEYCTRWWFFDDIFVCKDDKHNRNLYVYNLNNKEFKPTVLLLGKACIFMSGDILKSGKYMIHLKSSSLTVFDLEDGSTVFHEYCDVWNAHIYKNLIVLQIGISMFAVVNIETKQIEYEAPGIYRHVSKDGRIAFSTADYYIHILKWDDRSLETLKCCHEAWPNNLLLKNDLLLSVCQKEDVSNTTLCVWNTKTKTKLRSVVLGYSYCLESTCIIDKCIYLKRYLPLSSYSIDPYFIQTVIELWDYMNGTLVASVPSVNSDCKVSNDHVIIACRSSKLALWGLKKKDFIIDDLYFTKADYDNIRDFHQVFTKTKLAYIKQEHPVTALHIRDYEV